MRQYQVEMRALGGEWQEVGVFEDIVATVEAPEEHTAEQLYEFRVRGYTTVWCPWSEETQYLWRVEEGVVAITPGRHCWQIALP